LIGSVAATQSTEHSKGWWLVQEKVGGWCRSGRCT
jgi:hypothetical protein